MLSQLYYLEKIYRIDLSDPIFFEIPLYNRRYLLVIKDKPEQVGLLKPTK